MENINNIRMQSVRFMEPPKFVQTFGLDFAAPDG